MSQISAHPVSANVSADFVLECGFFLCVCVFVFFFPATRSNIAAGHTALFLSWFPQEGLGTEPEQGIMMSVTL